MTISRQQKSQWYRSEGARLFAEGFKAGREQAAAIVQAVAANEDWRPEDARVAGVKPGRIVRILKRTGEHIRNMPRPKRSDLDVEGAGASGPYA
jgi:hypothetical protein